ncbi:hypothetical protein [Streptomyces sp. DHE17-7]|uniref:hypothetical protein n=1 Tax=Streptomyces sp. DHE17-7 TaxID=2759949 RepID=UPI0022EB8CEF|nr:hypothetical protein [Streptomyces sp. DHE17-7]MBJ6620767.1 hypothetical protein [Streptomyces sp. DHE17-7]
MAFGAQELRVLRRALALALKPSPVSAQEARDCLRLAESLDEAMRESARMRAFLVADLARYRAALPGTATGYLALLDEALAAGHRPGADDLAALGALRGNPAAAALLARCAPQPPTAKPTLPAARTPGRPHQPAHSRRPAPHAPATPRHQLRGTRSPRTPAAGQALKRADRRRESPPQRGARRSGHAKRGPGRGFPRKPAPLQIRHPLAAG